MRRSRYTIILQILTICRTGANKTKIIYRGNLNFKIANPYINLLINNGLISIEPGNPKIYRTTTKGASLLKNLSQVNVELAAISPIVL